MRHVSDPGLFLSLCLQGSPSSSLLISSLSMVWFVICLGRTVFSNSSPSIAYWNPKIGLPTKQNWKFFIKIKIAQSLRHLWDQTQTQGSNLSPLFFMTCLSIHVSGVSLCVFFSPLSGFSCVATLLHFLDHMRLVMRFWLFSNCGFVYVSLIVKKVWFFLFNNIRKNLNFVV